MDIVERLREEAAGEAADTVYGRLDGLLLEAAAEIESLRKDKEEILKEAEVMVMQGYREAYDIMKGEKPESLLKRRMMGWTS